MTLEEPDKAVQPSFHLVVKRDAAFAREDRIKMNTMGLDGFSINRETVDMRYVEQLTDSEQLTALSYMVKHLKLHSFDGNRTLQDAVERLYREIETRGFAAFCGPDIPGNLAIPRKQELFAALNRCRELVHM